MQEKALFKEIIISHINSMLPADEWARFRALSQNEARSSLRGTVAKPDATPAELVEMALTEDAMTLADALPRPFRAAAGKVGSISGQPVYYVQGEGIYLWARDPASQTVLSVWLTHPAYPPNW